MSRTEVRPATFTSGALHLQGELRIPESQPAAGVVVCHPHTLYGGDMDNNVVVATCDGLAAAEIATLRFNFRGAGQSEGEFDRGEGEQQDLIAALDWLVEQSEIQPERIGVAGYSFGAVVAANVASDALSGLALISAPVAMADLRVEWGCPTLLIAGSEDDIAPTERIQMIARHSRGDVRIVDGADHSWWGYEQELGEAVAGFFVRQFA